MFRSSALLLGCALAWGTPAGTASNTARVIPPVRCVSLAGGPVSLPGDLHGRGAVLVMGFSRDSQEAVRGWAERLASGYATSPTVAYYEVAMLAEVPRLMRGIVLRSMKSEVPLPAQSHFLPLTADEAAWRSLVQPTATANAYLLVVDATGAVQWQTSAAPTDAAYAELKRHLP